MAAVAREVAVFGGSPSGSARLRLAALVLSQFFRAMADAGVALSVVWPLLAPDAPVMDGVGTWAGWVIVLLGGAILIEGLPGRKHPIAGRGRLLLANLVSLVLTVTVGMLMASTTVASGPIVLSLPLLTVGLYRTGRSRLALPLAQQAGLAPGRALAWLDLAENLGFLAALAVGDARLTFLHLAGLYALALLTVWLAPKTSPADQPPLQGCQRREARRARLGAIATAVACWAGLLAFLAADAAHSHLYGALIAALSGLGTGALLASLSGHSFRALGLVPLALTALGVVFLLALGDPTEMWVGFGIGLCGNLAQRPLLSRCRELAPVRDTTEEIAGVTAGVVILAWAGLARSVLPGGPMLWLGVATLLGAAVAWWQLARPAIEQFTEIVLLPIYRIVGVGPGIAAFPMHGPVLVVCNHTAWLDPLWLGKVIPRRIRPMMRSDFFDMPALRWLVRDIVHAIRVQMSGFRREAPELAEATAALRDSECLVLFPEGRLRRHARPTVRHFGRGVWHILHDCPETPVVVCWIEGGWGSFTSHAGGKPGRGKRLDFWRTIRVAVGPPQRIDPTILADVRATRQHLMQQCVQARALLGLPPGHIEQLGAEDSDD